MKHIFLLTAILMLNLSFAQQKLTPPSPGDTTWTSKVIKSNVEWKKILTPDQYTITREDGTESPFTKGNYFDNHEKGMYYCVSCHNPLFNSEKKFDSGTGWPSFWHFYSTKSVQITKDNSLAVTRNAVSCKRCDAHLGHVFNDGPEPTGLRYCIDGLALSFKKSTPKK